MTETHTVCNNNCLHAALSLAHDFESNLHRIPGQRRNEDARQSVVKLNDEGLATISVSARGELMSQSCEDSRLTRSH